MIRSVVLSKRAQKDLAKIPKHIRRLFHTWEEGVRNHGLEEIRKVPGYHDEPLKGARAGQRSIRLSRSWRAIYSLWGDHVVFAYVEEVNKHEY